VRLHRSSSWSLPGFFAALSLVALACGSHKHPPIAELSPEADAGGGGTGGPSGPCDTPTDDDGGLSLISQTSTITGRVLDPANKNPLYNVSVYIPKDGAKLPVLGKGVSCDRCGSTVVNPLVSVLTDETGAFTLNNVPFGAHSIVVQVGKWRKVVPINVSSKCLAAGDIPLPKNGTEGNMPQIAVTTGALDALECLLRNFGIDESEFVPGAGGTGHVHMFNGFGGNGPASTPTAEMALWNDAKLLSAYDIVALSCEGSEHNENKTNMQAMHDYAEAGGRVFGTHFHYTWLKNGPQTDWQQVAQWQAAGGGSPGSNYNVNETFPKGKAFAKWLVNVHASQTEGQIPLSNVTSSITSVTPSTSQDWIDLNANDVKYFTFNVPIGSTPEKQCGRVVFSDIHVFPAGGEQWPTGCGPVVDLEPQQKALEFLFFDLSACVQSDSSVPTPVH
jgi:hypothetical protein